MEIEIHPTEISQGENDYEDVLQHLTSTIGGKLVEGAKKTELFSSTCIYRVPHDLRKVNERAYTPRLIAIGPLHRNDKHLQTPMQHVKMSYANNLLCRLTTGMEGLELAEKRNAVLLHECLAEMKKLIVDANNCYLADVTMDEEMLLVDGCFILEFLYRARLLHFTKWAEDNEDKPSDGGDIGNSKVWKADPIFGNRPTLFDVENDLVLLENQIPFFVLEKLFQLTVGRIRDRLDKNWSLTDYVRWCYRKRIRPVKHSNKKNEVLTPSDCVLRIFGCTTAAAEEEEEEVQFGNVDHRTANYYHILHNLHDWYLPKKTLHGGYRPLDRTKQKHVLDRTKQKHVLMPSASQLIYAGVKFVPDASGNNLFKFEFTQPKGLFSWCRRARFVIPPLVIYDNTECYLRNLIAFEHCCPGVSQNVTSYAFVMDMLVNFDEDVEVLEKAKVLRNYLGASKDATHLFNNLCKETVLEHYFTDTCVKATKYSKRFWPKNMALLKGTYFDSPWTFIAFCVGFVAFVISLVEFARDFGKKG